MLLAWKAILWLLSLLSYLLLSVHLVSLFLVPMFCKPGCTSALHCVLQDRHHNVTLLLLKVVCSPPIISNNYQIWQIALLTEWIQKRKLSMFINNMSDYVTERIINWITIFFTAVCKNASEMFVWSMNNFLRFFNYSCHHVYGLVCWKVN